MSKRRTARSSLIPYPVIAAAVRGDPEAVNRVLDHYSGYIAALSMRRGCNQNGNPCFAGRGDPPPDRDEADRRHPEFRPELNPGGI